MISETLRLYPLAWIGPRRCVERFEFGGYIIPAGTCVSYSEWGTHRLPEYFAEPERFRPERFDKELGEKHAPTATSRSPRAAGSALACRSP